MLKKMVSKLLLFVFVFSLVFVPAGQQAHAAAMPNSGLFKSYVVNQVVYHPNAVAIGDVNNDSRNDVVMTTDNYYF